MFTFSKLYYIIKMWLGIATQKAEPYCLPHLTLRTYKRSKKMNVSNERLYKVWCGMVARCTNKNFKNFHRYGGRGIKVCEEWSGIGGYYRFKEWAYLNGYDDKAPKYKCTIDRIDNNKGYYPDNCRFIDAQEQAYNRETNKYIEVFGKKESVARLRNENGIKASTYYNRVARGVEGFNLFKEPKKTKKIICLETGIIYNSTNDASRKLKIKRSGISNVVYGITPTYKSYHWAFIDDKGNPLVNKKQLTQRRRKTFVRCVETGRIFDSPKKASEYLKTTSSNVCQSIRKKCKVKGFHFEYYKKGDLICPLDLEVK